ncbi:homocitrate synthase/isopropylmalate synthase family protein [Megasphaera cerevisiae]|jgi:homocitrate synthase NifV
MKMAFSIVDTTLTCLPLFGTEKEISSFVHLLVRLPLLSVEMEPALYEQMLQQPYFKGREKLCPCGKNRKRLREIVSFSGTELFHELEKKAAEYEELEPLDSLHMATAAAVEWFYAGGTHVVTAFAGAGGHACTEEVIMALGIAAELPQFQGPLPFLQDLAKQYERLSHQALSPVKPVLGKKIFTVESGIHVDGILKEAQLYELYPPDRVGLERHIVIGKFSGRRSIMLKLGELGIPISQTAAILPMAQQYSIQLGHSLTDQDFATLVERIKTHEEMLHC